MRIQLIQPPSNTWETPNFLEPLGLAYIGAVCRDAGHEVRIRDLVNIRQANVEQLFAEMDEFLPELVGFSAFTEQYKNALLIAEAVKARYGATVVFGGWHVSGEPRQSVEHPAIDYVVCSEGEDTILELLQHLETGTPALPDIAGLAWCEADGTSHLNEARRRIRHLTALPEPMREGLPMDSYRWPLICSAPVSKIRTLSVQASRGCPYKCSFCQTPALWTNLWTNRTPANVVDEIERLVDEYGIESLFMRDEEFTIKRRWVLEICEELIRRGLPKRLHWGSFGRVDDFDPDLVDALVAAGYFYAFMGLEATDAESSNLTQKFYKREEAENASRLLYDRGVITQGNWIIGFPWDTLESLEKGFAWLRTLPLHVFSVTFATPFGGTQLRREVEEKGLLLNDDPNYFNIWEPVIRTPNIPFEVLKHLPDKFMRSYYLRPSYFVRPIRTLLRRPSGIRIGIELVTEFVLRDKLFTKYKHERTRNQSFEVPERFHVPLAAARSAPARDAFAA